MNEIVSADNEATPETPPRRRGGIPTFLFALVMIWPFVMGQVSDDVRQGRENLFIVFIVPGIVGIGLIAFGLGRILWWRCPQLRPQRAEGTADESGVWRSFGLFLLVMVLWCVSPVQGWSVDAGKLNVLLFLGGATLVSIYQRGDREAVFASLLFAEVTAVAAFALSWLAAFYMGLSDPPPIAYSVSEAAAACASLAVPYAIVVALYDGYRETG